MQHDRISAGQEGTTPPDPDRDQATTALLKLFSESNSRGEYLDGVVRLLRDWSRCRCVGIRVLDSGGGIPYESYLGYSREFWESENWLSVNCDQCICIRVIKGAPEPQDAVAMTPFGSFRSGNTFEFVAGLSPEARTRFRGVCMRTGFASLAVVPLSYRGQILGAIHIADEREGWVPRRVVEFIERMAPLTGEAVHRFGLEEELRRNHDLQAAMNSILRMSLEGLSLQDIVQRAQDILLSMPWRSFEPRGFIRLLDGTGEFPPIPGHREVPICSGGRTMGHIVLQLREGARALRQEEETLIALADVLAGIVVRYEMQERLLRAQRLEMAGRIAGQVAHDLNNLLTPMAGYPQLIKRQLPPDHPAVKYCDIQLKLARQMVAINEDLLTLGRRGRMKQQPTDLNYLAGMALSQMEELPPDIHLQAELASGLPQINAAPAQFVRVISNLLSNAREAMESGGVLTVRTGKSRLDQPLRHYSQVNPGEYVWLMVRDTGGGIPSEIISRVFDPFFTTKEPGRKSGSGLGLSIVQAIVDDHRGYVDLESEVNEGASFTIYLPVLQPHPRDTTVGASEVK
jgi:signal transduction histidine kinase